MRICVLAGGVGSARFCSGLVRVEDPENITIVGNTGDDERMHGLHVSPDIDTVLYHLAGLTDWERGWGVDDESFTANDRYRELVSGLGETGIDMQEWFALGDRDIATHLVRAHLLDHGKPLSGATDAVRRALGLKTVVLPMSDDPVRTVVVTSAGERLAFQEYFVRRGHADEITDIEYSGADTSSPAPGVLEAITSAGVILIPPSNPLLSIGPLLAVPGIRDAVVSSVAMAVAISPIVGGKTIKGPADKILRSLGREPSSVGVAEIYRGLVDVFVLDNKDRFEGPRIEGMRTETLDTIMTGPDVAARLAKEVVALAG